MGKFLESEKTKQLQFKTKSPTISEQAKAEGLFKGKPRPFCLPLQYAHTQCGLCQGNAGLTFLVGIVIYYFSASRASGGAYLA